MMIDALKLNEVGEKQLIQELTSVVTPAAQLIDGLGHDSAFLDLQLNSDELLMLNTDRSGMNIAYKLGLADGTCVGDFAISHAVSDIFAAGGRPLAITVALMLPHDLNVGFVKDIMKGADAAARKYGAFIAAGDTKHGSKFAIVVTVLGKCHRSDKLTRSGAQPEDLIVAVGEFGAMLAGVLACKHKLNLEMNDRQHIEQAVIFQNPPYKLSLALAGQHLAHACIDNSDGIAGSIHSMCDASDLGAVLDQDQMPIPRVVQQVAGLLNLDPFQLCLGSGDWQHVFAIPADKLDRFIELANHTKTPAAVIGVFKSTPGVHLKTQAGTFELPCLANDRFGIGGIAWFDSFEQKVNFKGAKVQ